MNLPTSTFTLLFLLMVLFSLLDRSSGSRNSPSKTGHRSPSLLNGRTSATPATTESSNRTNSIKHQNQHQHIATRMVGGFTANSHTSRKNHTSLKHHLRHDRDCHTTQFVNLASSNQKLSNYKRQISNTDPYSLNKYHSHDSMAMRQQRGEGEQQYLMKNKYRSQIPNVASSSSRVLKRNRKGKVNLSSTIAVDYVGGTGPSIFDNILSLKDKVKSSVEGIDIQDSAIFLTYVFNIASISLPIILVPMIAADPCSSPSAAATLLMNSNGGDLAGKILAMSALGAGLGKIINGFICQGLGARKSGSMYLLGLASFSFLLSTTSTIHAQAIAGMEFCASIMWTACNVLIANKYAKSPKEFASAVTKLSLCSTAGTLSCKIIGSMLLSNYHWRSVARLASVMSTCAAALLFFVVKETKETKERTISWAMGGSRGVNTQTTQGLTISGITSSISRVISKPIFWLAAASHSCSHLARNSDKILATFLREITQLPRPLCGSLTSSVTIGLIVGLVSGRKMVSMDNSNKKRFIMKRQFSAFLSSLSIAVLAHKSVVSLLGKKMIAAAVTMVSFILAASLSVQFYQFPAKFAKTFGDDKAICISFTDACAFLLSSPIWAAVSKIAISAKFGQNGWSVAWLLMSAFFAIGGGLTMKTLPTMIDAD